MCFSSCRNASTAQSTAGVAAGAEAHVCGFSGKAFPGHPSRLAAELAVTPWHPNSEEKGFPQASESVYTQHMTFSLALACNMTIIAPRVITATATSQATAFVAVGAPSPCQKVLLAVWGRHPVWWEALDA